MQAELSYLEALKLLPAHMISLERLGRLYLRYRESIPAAMGVFQKLLEVNPLSSTAWYLVGRGYMAAEQYPDAFEAYNRAVNLEPNDSQVWMSLGVLYYAYGQYQEALGMLHRAVRLDPDSADAWYNVGALYETNNQQEHAVRAYAKAKECGLDTRFVQASFKPTALTLSHTS